MSRREREGDVLTFQVFKICPLSGEKTHLSTVVVKAKEITRKHTVEDVKDKLESRFGLRGKSFKMCFNGSVMDEDDLFYADHYMLLPATIQVVTL
jgi:hypothetical protein